MCRDGKDLIWRDGREAEGAPLLREYGSKAHRGFESLSLRQFQIVCPLASAKVRGSFGGSRPRPACRLTSLLPPIDDLAGPIGGPFYNANPWYKLLTQRPFCAGSGVSGMDAPGCLCRLAGGGRRDQHLDLGSYREMLRHRFETSRGFTLIEVLVTMIILAVGLLGLAGMQIAGMKANHSALLRTQATFAAYDLADRMRANPTDFAGQTLTIDNGGTYPDLPREFASWAHDFDAAFPAPSDGARATVNCSNGGACSSGNCEILLRWDDSRPEGGADRAQAVSRNTSELEFRACSRLP